MNRGEARSAISRPPKFERLQIAFAGERLNRKLQDRRDHRAEQVAALVGDLVVLPVRDQPSTAAFDDQEPISPSADCPPARTR